MINTWLISGDTHGSLDRYTVLKDFEPGTAALIILGDVAFNYTGGPQDNYLKDKANQYKNYTKQSKNGEKPMLKNKKSIR